MIITCPESSCRAENDARHELCINCATPLRGYVKLLNYHHHLFNQGLALARSGAYTQARDKFSSVVEWCPKDIEARNALAMACFAMKDLELARFHWQKVLEQVPNDATARKGLDSLQKIEVPATSRAGKQPARRAPKKQVLLIIKEKH
jgi:thioredoxin-like negative regulator of GroEL